MYDINLIPRFVLERPRKWLLVQFGVLFLALCLKTKIKYIDFWFTLKAILVVVTVV